MDKLNLKALMENKQLLWGVVAGAVVLLGLILSIVIFSVSSKNNSQGGNSQYETKVYKEKLSLFTTDNIGKAIEVQALLAKQGIEVKRSVDGTKSEIYMINYTMADRDNALAAIVKSGLMDEHVGLEIFDKGDFTSTKEDKKIRLVRAMNGELSRLIRKIASIENAQVFVSIPEQTFFESQQKPITATVQVTVPSGEKLDNMKVKAITNLLLGAIQGLQSENISITDTNGTVYSSIISASDDALSKIEENDKYMQSKVAQQLDRLVGKGNYVVTVSTFLTQAPVEKTSIIYDPSQKTAINEQGFSESLGDDSSDINSATNAVSTYLPYGLPNSGSNSTQNRSYSRKALETQYGVSKTQVNEYTKAGVIEEISIAVSLEQSAVPLTMTLQELKEVIANAASPLVNPDNVAIAFIDSTDAILAPDSQNQLPKPEESGNAWWVVGIVLLSGLVLGLRYIVTKVKKETSKQEEELYLLREMSQKQQQQLESYNSQTSELLRRQEQMAQNLIEHQKMEALKQNETMQAVLEAQQNKQQNNDLKEIVSGLDEDFDELDSDFVVGNIKKWIDD